MTPHGPRGASGALPRHARAAAVSVMGLAAAFTLGGCGDGAPGVAPVEEAAQPSAAASAPGTTDGKPVAIATGVSDQTRVVAHMYAQQLEAEGIAAQVVDTGETREDLFNALQAHEIHVVPDFTGDLYVHVAENETRATPQPTPSPDPTATEDPGLIGSLARLLGFTGDTGPSGTDVYNALPEAMPSGVEVLDESAAENTDRFVVTPETAINFELDDLTDVGEHCRELAVGMPGDYAQTAQGVQGLENYYDCEPKSAPEIEDYQERVDALLNDDVQAAVLPESSPVIEDDDLRVLDDPNNLYRPEKLVAVASEGLTGGAVSAINGITTSVRTGDLAMMTRLVSGDNPEMTPEEAAAFIREQPR